MVYAEGFCNCNRHTHLHFHEIHFQANEIKHVLKVSRNWLNNFTVNMAWNVHAQCWFRTQRSMPYKSTCTLKSGPSPCVCAPQSIISFYFQIFIIIYIVSHIYDGFAYEIFHWKQMDDSMSLINFESHFGWLDGFALYMYVCSVRCGFICLCCARIKIRPLLLPGIIIFDKSSVCQGEFRFIVLKCVCCACMDEMEGVGVGIRSNLIRIVWNFKTFMEF